jgi:hypothetical protein
VALAEELREQTAAAQTELTAVDALVAPELGFSALLTHATALAASTAQGLTELQRTLREYGYTTGARSPCSRHTAPSTCGCGSIPARGLSTFAPGFCCWDTQLWGLAAAEFTEPPPSELGGSTASGDEQEARSHGDAEAAAEATGEDDSSAADGEQVEGAVDRANPAALFTPGGALTHSSATATATAPYPAHARTTPHNAATAIMSFHTPATHRRTPAARTAAAAVAVMAAPEPDEFDDSPLLSLEAMGLSAASLAAIGGAPLSTTTAAAAVPIVQPRPAPPRPPAVASSPPPAENTLTLRAEIIHR